MHQCVSKTRIIDSLCLIPAVIYCDGAFAPEDRRAPEYLGGRQKTSSCVHTNFQGCDISRSFERPPHCAAASMAVSADFLQRPKLSPAQLFGRRSPSRLQLPITFLCNLICYELQDTTRVTLMSCFVNYVSHVSQHQNWCECSLKD